MSTLVKHIDSKLSTEERISHLLSKNDRSALELIFDNYSVILLNVINRIVKDEAISQDVLQEALLKVWNNGHTYDKSKGSLFTWLVTICRNTAVDKTRTKDFRLTEESKKSPDLVSIEKQDKSDELENLYMKQMIDQLPPIQKNLIDLAYFQGYTQKEIAQNLAMPLGTVKTRIRLALKNLRSII